jgi:hypothetical protein
MRKHNGMRPQDIAILLKICANGGNPWNLASLAHSLRISNSEVSESLSRSQLAGLIDTTKKRVNRQSLFDFLTHGFQYVFPHQPGPMVRGVPTAHSHPFMKSIFTSDSVYVWPDPHSKDVGFQIDPLYQRQVEAVHKDELFYKLLALSDVLRVGKVREKSVAVEEIKREFDL